MALFIYLCFYTFINLKGPFDIFYGIFEWFAVVIVIFFDILLTPFLLGYGIFLFLKYPSKNKMDFWHYCFIYPGFFLFIVFSTFLVLLFLGKFEIPLHELCNLQHS